MTDPLQLVTGNPDDLAEAVKLAGDDELIAAYQSTEGNPGDPWADALAAEMERRDIDF